MAFVGRLGARAAAVGRPKAAPAWEPRVQRWEREAIVGGRVWDAIVGRRGVRGGFVLRRGMRGPRSGGPVVTPA